MPLCVCVFSEHVMECLAPIEHAVAAQQNLAQGRNVPCSIDRRGHVVLPPEVNSSVASILFCLAGGCTHAVDARAPGQNSSSHRSLRPKLATKSAKHHVVVAVVGWSRSMAAARGPFTMSSSQTGSSNSTSLVDVADETVTAPAVCQGCTATILANDDTACQWSETTHSQRCSCPCGCGRRVNELE